MVFHGCFVNSKKWRTL